ncbi:terpene synthase [Ganoderma sinense ZZ0214-1]|uniref:Terpene synthase n=1 Tax=Ganoderma sinense ZZ0214-1 TaxID=1077348 RepID=A0A2G8RLG5_9APHY|nr:terpene synthase [Ganoderma sinense ZZ0214-1]
MNPAAPEKTASALNGEAVLRSQEHDKVRGILRDFLKHSMTTNNFLTTESIHHGSKLYQDVSRKVLDFIEAADDDSNYEHQRYIALYTACLLYVDDLGSRHLEAVAQFSRRFTTAEKQLNPALDVLTDLLRQSYDLWPQTGADAIVSGTLEAVAAMHVECTTGNMKVTPQATWWPNYLRSRTGICPPYAHFNFMKSWRATPESYMQLLPYLEFYIVAANLSFNKEQLVGEMKNYVHVRANADQMTAIDTLRLLADEVHACAQRTKMLIGEDSELMAIWRSFEQGCLIFHVKTQRYRLVDLAL